MEAQMSRSDRVVTCDEPDCASTPIYRCACAHCERYGWNVERFDACAAHTTSVRAMHRRLRGSEVQYLCLAPSAEVEQDRRPS